MRDIESDYRAAYLAEYEQLKGCNDKAAARVAAILADEFGVEVEPEVDKSPEPKPSRGRRRGGAKETTAQPKLPETTSE